MAFFEPEIIAVIFFPKPHAAWADSVFRSPGVWRPFSF